MEDTMAAHVETMAWTGQKPWHDQGREVSPDMDIEEWLVAAGLDWTVSAQSVYLRREKVSETGEVIESFEKDDRCKFLIRDSDGFVLDRGLGDRYKPVQNADAFEVFRKYVEIGGMTMDTAGSLKDGQYVWGLAKLNQGFTLGNGDDVEGNLLMMSPHKYGKAMQVRLTPTRVVCWNTLSIALAEEDIEGITTFRHNHAGAFTDDSIKKMENTIGLASKYMSEFEEQARLMASKRMPQADQVRYMANIFDPEFLAACKRGKMSIPTTFDDYMTHDFSGRTIRKIIRSYPDEQRDISTAEGPVWGAFNMVTFAWDHLIGRTNDNKLETAWIGRGASVKNEALAMAVAYAKAA